MSQQKVGGGKIRLEPASNEHLLSNRQKQNTLSQIGNDSGDLCRVMLNLVIKKDSIHMQWHQMYKNIHL